MKKILSVLLLLFLCMTLFACSKEKTSEADSLSALSPASEDYDKYKALDDTANGWGLKKNEGAAPSVPKSITETLSKYGAVYMGGREKAIYLTFDEGYENGQTEKILDILKETNTPAAFFITGGYIDSEPEIVKRMTDEGHIVGNHTNSHPSMPSVKDNKKLADDILKLNEKYEKLCGKEMKYFRPPAGEYSERTLCLTNDMGLKTVFWSFAYVDWEKDSVKGGDYAYSHIMPYLHGGEIMLLHAVSKDNADALKQIITDAKEKGFVFLSLDEL